VILRETETDRSGYVDRRLAACNRLRDNGRDEHLDIDTVRATEAVVDVRRGLRSLIRRFTAERCRETNCDRATELIAVECAQTHVRQVGCRPKQYDGRDRPDESTVAPPTHPLEDSMVALEGAAPWHVAHLVTGSTWRS
jgi:hypothetical protein